MGIGEHFGFYRSVIEGGSTLRVLHYSIILWYVATVEGEILLRYRKIQYLKTVSKKTGKVATNKKIKS